MKFYVAQGNPVGVFEEDVKLKKIKTKKRTITMATAKHPKTGKTLYKIVG